MPALSPIFRSDSQAEILALLLLHPETEYSLTDISKLSAVNVAIVHKEIERLGKIGIITERRVGKSRLVHATVPHALFLPLLALIEHSYGPLFTLTEIIHGIPGIDEAYILDPGLHAEQGTREHPPRILMCSSLAALILKLQTLVQKKPLQTWAWM